MESALTLIRKELLEISQLKETVYDNSRRSIQLSLSNIKDISQIFAQEENILIIGDSKLSLDHTSSHNVSILTLYKKTNEQRQQIECGLMRLVGGVKLFNDEISSIGNTMILNSKLIID